MKQLFVMLITIISCLGFFACNQTSDKKTEESKTETEDTTNNKSLLAGGACAGIENLLIINDSAYAMMARFDSIYKKIKTLQPLGYLVSSIWIDAKIINAYANFFDNAGKTYDGARFVNGATNDHTNTRILLVPTKPGAPHTDVWGTGIIELESGNTPEYSDWETEAATANELKDNFYSIYRRSRSLPRDKDPLSESVWMSKCVFTYLRDQISNTANQIDGIRVYMGAYGKMTGTVPGQIHPNQSTILLVPTTGHKDRWDLLRPGSSNKKKYDALNHGELCPQSCP